MAGVLRAQFQSFAPLELSWSLARADDYISAADAPGAACGFSNTQQCLSDLNDDVDYAGEGAGVEAAVSAAQVMPVKSEQSHVTRHTPHVARRTLHVTRHTPHVKRRTSHVTGHTLYDKPVQPGAIDSQPPSVFRAIGSIAGIIFVLSSCCTRPRPPLVILPVLGEQYTSHVTRHTSHVTRHTSHVTRHTSHVTRHTSHITRHTSHVT
jgi:hypothetical protein